MEEHSKEEQANRGEKKNQKNIYVHKIKSLMRISKDSLHQDEKEINIALNKYQNLHSESTSKRSGPKVTPSPSSR